MNIIALAVILVLVLLAAVHLYWGMGGRWPGHDDQSLVEMVVGRTAGMKAPDFWACLFVTGALLASAALVAFACGVVPTPDVPTVPLIVTLGFWTSCAVFALRGLAGFVPGIFRYADGTAFAHLNLVFYSPLCLAIAAGYTLAYVFRH